MAGAIRNGVANFRRHASLSILLYAAELMLALGFSLPFLVVIDGSLADSPFAAAMTKAWSVDVLAELFATRENILSSFLIILAFYAVTAFMFKQFVNGGIFYSFLSTRPIGPYVFFGESGRLLKGNLKISGLMIPVYLFLTTVGIIIAARVPSTLFGRFGDAAANAFLLRSGVVCLFSALGVVLSELLRVRLAAYPEETLAESFRAAIGFYRANFVKCYALYMFYLVPFVAFGVVAHALASAVTRGLSGMTGVTVELVLFQACAALRIAQALLFTATIALVFRKTHPGRFRHVVQEELTFD